jgi:Ca-activated chloride channel family protein
MRCIIAGLTLVALVAVRAGFAAAPAEDVARSSLTLQAIEMDGAVVREGLAWTVKQAGNVVHGAREGGEGVVVLSVQPGDYQVEVTRRGDGLKAQGHVRIGLHEARTLTLPLATALQATLASIPGGTAPVGADVVVSWTGPDRKGDWIGLAAQDSGDDAWLDYKYTREGSPLVLHLPTQPGRYEIRYVLGTPAVVLARLPIMQAAASPGGLGPARAAAASVPPSIPVAVKSPRAAVEAPASARGGSQIEVEWKGPNGPGDYISTAPAGAPDADYVTWMYTRDGSPVALHVPATSGNYEVRYASGDTDTVLARAPLKVTAVTASLRASRSAPAGSTIVVAWSGPGYSGDYITVGAPGAAAGDYRSWTYALPGKSARLPVPDEPGRYEIRYVLGGSNGVIAHTGLQVTAVAATLTVPSRAPAKTVVDVAWTGPAYEGDYITVTQAGARDSDFLESVTLRPGVASPVRLRLAAEPGAYEIRYVLGHSHRVIGRVPVTITP